MSITGKAHDRPPSDLNTTHDMGRGGGRLSRERRERKREKESEREKENDARWGLILIEVTLPQVVSLFIFGGIVVDVAVPGCFSTFLEIHGRLAKKQERETALVELSFVSRLRD